MDKEFLKNIEEWSRKNQYRVSMIPYHTHNGTDSPLITAKNVVVGTTNNAISIVDSADGSSYPIMVFSNGLGDEILIHFTSTDSYLDIEGLGLQIEGDLKVLGNQYLPKASSDPSSPVEGQIYFNTTSKHFYGYNGTAWKQLDN